MEKNLVSSSPSYQNLSKILDLLTGSAIFLSTCSDAKHHTCSISSKCACLWCVLLFCACALWGSWGTERLSHVCEVVWLLGGWAELQIQDWFIAKPSLKVKFLNSSISLWQREFVRNANDQPCPILIPTEVRTTEGTRPSALPAGSSHVLKFQKGKRAQRPGVCVCLWLSFLAVLYGSDSSGRCKVCRGQVSHTSQVHGLEGIGQSPAHLILPPGFPFPPL